MPSDAFLFDPTIDGHPSIELEPENPTSVSRGWRWWRRAEANPVVITVCAECGRMRSVLWLTKDRWLCNQCKAEGTVPPNMFPIA